MQSDKPLRRFYLLTYPRTASNLLLKILALEDQPNVKSGSYFFLPLHALRLDHGSESTHIEALAPDQKQKEIKCMKGCFSRLIQHLTEAEAKNQLTFVKEHTTFLTEPVAKTRAIDGQNSVTDEMPWMLDEQNGLTQPMEGRSVHNETLLSDSFLKTWKPSFLIRHPALAFPSYYRAVVRIGGEDYARSSRMRRYNRYMMTLRWTRQLYDFYADHFAATESAQGSCNDCNLWPLVLDADDVITHPTVVAKFCDLVGLDATKLKFKWEKERQERSPREKAMMSTIDESTGVNPSKATGCVDIDKEAARWKTEFGEDIGQMIDTFVREAMPDYMFLRSKRLRP
ncbi:hypothetical protein EYZ11_005637 [Aspergillus tanneri]|uniref:Sulfotransferase domain-containing protein n=1 Tax=Aspergillus tanneri TaxID=1220188 RepID=A0A4S3JHZ2_9EURO|nr:uncharacterized protein ATNIH1004_005278 [Aspergillus tanneri]KAA8649377.1 hypothetical protein ATNIH1004_005278 [Aspergillus tanneri]THC94875.1 hypothetical protein EYZ11_005637 [Aspergillus tanneri]